MDYRDRVRDKRFEDTAIWRIVTSVWNCPIHLSSLDKDTEGLNYEMLRSELSDAIWYAYELRKRGYSGDYIRKRAEEEYMIRGFGRKDILRFIIIESEEEYKNSKPDIK